MKFKMRTFADQIVGVFIILSLVALAFVIVVLGKHQKWFTKKYEFYTVLSSATGLSNNMAVLYKGFTIGSVKSFDFKKDDNDDNVKVIFTINQDYIDRAREGSIVELQVSPIGLGNQFQFYPGKGDVFDVFDDKEDFIPAMGTLEAQELERKGLAAEIKRDDGIGALLSSVSSIMGQLDEALGTGTDKTEIGKMIGSLNRTLAGLEAIPDSLDNTINGLRLQLNPILANLNALTGELNDPDGLIYTVLDTDKDVYTNLVGILNSVTSLLDSLDRTISFIPSQLPQVAGLLMDLRVTLGTAGDVLTSLTNNPLLRGGVPNRTDSQNSDISPRGIRF